MKRKQISATESQQQPEQGRRHEPQGRSRDAATHQHSPPVSHEQGGRGSKKRKKNSSGE
jgi:hypothetical protein